MLKALFALALMIAVIVVAANFMTKHHSTGPAPAGPVVINVPVKNPLS